MDKKRRDKTQGIFSSAMNVHFLDITEKERTTVECGLLTEKYCFKENYGDGYYELHSHDGLYISVLNANFHNDIIFNGAYLDDILELSFLIHGEQIISVKGLDTNIVYEKEHSYIVFLPKTEGQVLLRKNKNIKEVKIRMDSHFLQKHHLKNEINSLDINSFSSDNDFMLSISETKQELLYQLLNNNNKGVLKRLILESLSLQLITLQMDDLESKEYKVKGNGVLKKIHEVHYYISNHLSLQHSIHDLAIKFGLNDFILKKEFKEVFGQTIFEYSNSLRMEKAKNLLVNSELPIYEISEKVGYKNSTHFSAAFKKHENLTPKKFRKVKIKEFI